MARRGLLTALLLFLSSASLADAPRIAIIIDDLGYHLANGKRAIRLPGPITFSFLPGSPRAKQLADHAHQNGKDVLLHLPLQAYASDDQREPSEIDLDMSRETMSAVVEEALRSVPHVIGINSHRGSLLTRHPGNMQWLMEEILDRENLFFIDSYTHHESVALQIAVENNVEAIKRDVFLDPDPSPGAVEREFERFKALARKRGQALAIGHPYPATLDLLERELPKLADEGFELVRVSELLQ